GGPVVGRDSRQVFPADVQRGAHGQGQGVTAGVADDPGQGEPDVAVDELLSGRPGGGGVVQAGPLHAGPVALGRRVVLGEQPAGLLRQEVPEEVAEEDAGEEGDFVSQGAQQAVGAAELQGEVAGAEPCGGGAAAAGEQPAV